MIFRNSDGIGVGQMGGAPVQVRGNEMEGYIPSAFATSEFYLDVAKGLIAGHSLKSKFGRNPEVGKTGNHTIWNSGGAYTGFDAVDAQTVTVTSSSTEDGAGLTGLYTVRLFGLDVNGLPQTEDITMNGVTSVVSILSYLRMDTAKGITAGTDGHNVGDITIRQSVSTEVIFAVMPATYNTTMIAAYTIPADKVGYLISQKAAIANKQAASVDMRIRMRQQGGLFATQAEAALNSEGTSFIEQEFKIPKRIEPMTDMFIEGTASSTVAVAAFFDILLVDI